MSTVARLRHRANVAYTRATVLGRRVRERRDVAKIRVRSLPPFQRAEQWVDRPNTFFSREALLAVDGHVQRAAHAEPGLRLRLGDSRIAGLRSWEYGTLLGSVARHPERPTWHLLDVGAGKSAIPRYLVASGNAARVTTLDLPDSYEATREEMAAESGVERRFGDMLDMPFEDGSFDVVTCISAIEHLDGDRLAAKHGRAGGERLPYDEYLAASRRALGEMMRVVRPGGFLYLTTDAYLADRQTTDKWSAAERQKDIWSAYRMEDVEDTFLRPLRDAGFEFAGGEDYDPELLVRDTGRATYRGRYFTTFAIWARMPGTGPPRHG